MVVVKGRRYSVALVDSLVQALSGKDIVMVTEHTVMQGEHLSLIARQYGFGDWRTIYNDPLNSEFRQKRPNPDVLYPGDQLNIPDKEPKVVIAQTEKRHRFVKTIRNLSLRITVRDCAGHAVARKRYKLEIGPATSPMVREGNTSDDGLIEQTIPTDSQEGRLTLWEGNGQETNELFKWNIRIGFLDPVDKITGVQARLKNLGFFRGAIDGSDDARTRAAIISFQNRYGLPANGVLEAQTMNKLLEIHGS